jgi:hypothetical protein
MEKIMLLKIIITYFDGRAQDILNHGRLSPQAACERRDHILEEMQKCIQSNSIFYAGDGLKMTAYGPDVLKAAHFKCEILEEPDAATTTA